MKRVRILLGLLVVLVPLILTACETGKEAGSSARVAVINLNEGQPLQADVLTDGARNPDVVEVTLKNDTRVPTSTPTTGTTDTDTSSSASNPQDVIMTSYRITYFRSGGGAVPSPLEGGMALYLPANGGEGATKIVALTSGAKSSPPLADLVSGGEVMLTAQIEFTGTDRANNPVTATGVLTILVANYEDTTITDTTNGNGE